MTSLTDPTPELLYKDLYCARGQDENFIKAVKNDLASDRTSDHAFLANHLRLFYSCAAYVLIHSLRDNTLAHTELARAQPMSIILKLFKLAVRVIQYKDRIKLSLPGACPVKGLLARVSEILYLVPRPPPPEQPPRSVSLCPLRACPASHDPLERRGRLARNTPRQPPCRHNTGATTQIRASASVITQKHLLTSHGDGENRIRSASLGGFMKHPG